MFPRQCCVWRKEILCSSTQYSFMALETTRHRYRLLFFALATLCSRFCVNLIKTYESRGEKAQKIMNYFLVSTCSEMNLKS